VNRDKNNNYTILKVKIKQPETRPRRNILREYGTRRWNCKEKYLKT